jgi:hypothetical protein
MGVIKKLRTAFRREGPFGPQGVEWCHGESAGHVTVQNLNGSTEVKVQCSECVEGVWKLTHRLCEKCESGRYGTTCVKTRDRGYRVAFTCTECGHIDEHFQWED